MKLHVLTIQIVYLLAHSSRIVIPRDNEGPFGTRIGVNVTGVLSETFGVQAYMTSRTSSSEPAKYGVVVMNSYEGASSDWNPQPVSATIAFRGVQVCPFPKLATLRIHCTNRLAIPFLSV